MDVGALYDPFAGMEDEESFIFGGVNPDDPTIGPSVDEFRPQSIVDGATAICRNFGFEPESLLDAASAETISAEVGDDEIAITTAALMGAAIVQAHNEVGMRTSWKDTAISRWAGNYAEDCFLRPADYWQTWKTCHKTGWEEDISFLDVPKLRLLVPVSPTRINHSDTFEGKCSMVGARMAWVPRRSPMRAYHEVANLIQDVTMSLTWARKPAYLPVHLGGMGKMVPFGNPDNFRNFFSSYRGGRFAPLANYLVNRLLLHSRGTGSPLERDEIIADVCKNASVFRDWIKGHSVYVPTVSMGIPSWCGNHMAAEHGDNRTVNSVLDRLVAAGRLVTEEQVNVHLEHNALCEALLGATSMAELRAYRQEAVDKWRGFSPLSLVIQGFARQLTGPIMHETEFVRDNVIPALTWAQQRRTALRGIFMKKALFWPTVLRQIYERGPMHVDLVFHPVTGGEIIPLGGDRAYDAPDHREPGWLDELEQWLRSDRDLSKVPRSFIDDDEALLHINVEAIGAVIMITDDIRLCRRMNRTLGVPVVRVPCELYYAVLYYGAPVDYESTCRTFFPEISTWKVEEDLGSIEAYSESNFRDGVGFRSLRRTKTIWDGPLGKHFSQRGYQKDTLEDWAEKGAPLANWPEKYTFDHSNVLRSYRRNRARGARWG